MTDRDNSPLLTAADFANLSLLEPYAPLQRLLASARVVGSDEMPHTVVTMNTQVVLHDETTGERRVVRVVFPADADPAAGLVSERELGDGMHRLRLEQVIYQPEYSLRTNLFIPR